MGNKDRSYSAGFTQALLSVGNPEKFVDEVAKLLGPKGVVVRDWAEGVDNLGSAVSEIIEKGVRDEWEFLFSISNPKSPFRNGVGKSEGEKPTVPAPGVFHVKKNKPFTFRVKGKTMVRLVDEILSELISLSLSSTRRVVVLYGGPRSGKSIILSEVCRRLWNEIGVETVDIGKGNNPKPTSNSRTVHYMDDADVELSNQIGGGTTCVSRFFKVNHVILFLTCRDIGKLESIMTTCDPILFEIEEHTPEDIVEIVSSMDMAGYALSRETCEKVVQMVTAAGCTNKLPAVIDTAIKLLYPTIRQDFDHSSIRKSLVSLTFEEGIREAVSSVTGVKFEQYSNSTRREISKRLRESIIGQDNIIDQILPVVLSISAGLTDPSKPSGVLFFYGPTGVGKTEMARALAKVVFDGKIHKEDMNTFSERHSVARLIGAPPGYVGYAEPPEFLKFIDTTSRGVLLLDEIEKAHETVMDLIMELMDTGFLRDASGIQHDARGFMIIMTSNISFGKAKSITGFDTSTCVDYLEEVSLSGQFKKEFLGRIDKVCRFNDISTDVLEEISMLLIKRLLERLKLVGIEATIDDSIVSEVASQYDKKTGVRSMRNFVETTIKNRILEG
jgi:hypothetical protein